MKLRAAAIAILLACGAARAEDRPELAADVILPIGGMLHGFGPGIGPEFQWIDEDACGRSLDLGLHLSVHSAPNSSPAYLGGLLLERRWYVGNDQTATRLYFAFRAELTGVAWQSSTAIGVASGLGLGVQLSAGVDLAAGAMIALGEYNLNPSSCTGYCGGAYGDLIGAVRLGYVFSP